MTTSAYREPWFWAVFAPLIIIALVCSVLLSFAVVGADNRISDDYYKQGRMINNRFTAELHAEQLQIKGQLQLDRVTREVELALEGQQLPKAVTLRFSHPASAELDRALVLRQASPNRYFTQVESLPKGRYYLLLEGVSDEGAWRVNTEMDFDSVDSATFGDTYPL